MFYKGLKYYMTVAAIAFTISLTGCGAQGTEPAQAESSGNNVVNESIDESTAAASEGDVTTEADEGKDSQSETNEAGEETSSVSKADDEDKGEASESDNSQAVTMYTTESITLHKDASSSGEDLGVVAIGSTVEAYEVSGDYIRVVYDGQEGYVLKDYVTEDKETADKAVAASKEAAQQSTSKQSSGSGKSSKKSSKECLDNGLLN